jgi:nucleoid-associated protein YgaU
MNRTRVRRRRVGAVLVALGVAVGLGGPVLGGAVTADAPRLVSVHPYTVRSGDTVWAIAQRLSPAGADPRPLVDAILRENQAGPGLTPGEVISIPAD